LTLLVGLTLWMLVAILALWLGKEVRRTIQEISAWRLARRLDREARIRATVATQSLVDCGCIVTRIFVRGRLAGMMIRRGDRCFYAAFTSANACAEALNQVRDELLGLGAREEVP
jgi:hypothetical protein